VALTREFPWVCAGLLALLACGPSEPASSTTGAISPGAAAATAQATPASLPAADTIDRYTDLLRLGEHFQQVESGARVVADVWDLGRHYRPVLVQSAGRVVLGPVPPGAQCRAVFGVAIEPGEGAGAVRFRLSARAAGSADRLVYETTLAGRGSEARWIDRVEAIPEFPGQEFSLVLEVAPELGATARGGWSAPHVVCRTPRTPLVDLPHPHVILISLDTLRADHLGSYGYARDTSPVLDAFAAEAMVFEAAFAPANWTLPSHASLFTGVSPAKHGAGHASVYTPLAQDGPATIAELLRDSGYWTIGFTAGGLMGRSNGLDRGFQWWTERIRANLHATLPGFFDAIGTAPTKPLFLLLHSYDIHGPYAYLPNAEEIHVGPRTGASQQATGTACEGPECRDRDAEWKRIRAIKHEEYQRLDRFEGLDQAVDAYDRGIRFVDSQLGALFDRLREIGIYDRSIIVITSDHGESLYDHSLYLGHSYTLYDEEIHVPLLVRLPGGSPGRSPRLVQLMDVAPLILEAAGVPVPASIEGRNPIARARAGAPEPTQVFGEASQTGARFARSSDWKYVAPSLPAGDPRNKLPRGLEDRFEFGEQSFDLLRDPHEQHALAIATAPSSAPLETLRAAALAHPQPSARNDEPAPVVDAVQQEQLRALGYVR
jgi:arylsulfatase A-like enzyme